MSASKYRRVPLREPEDTTGQPSGGDSSSEFASGATTTTTARTTTSTTTRSRGELIEDKGVALGWVIVAFLLARWTDFFGLLWKDERIHRNLLKISLGGCLVVVTLCLYLTVYLPRVKGLSDPSVWGVYCPRVLPAMCVIGILTYFTLIRALWPLWGFMAPLISGTEIMGILMALHFVPTFGIC